ncbi:MAG: hypothetical protein A2104_06500 [Candidatus Melainabacteria bacterium GWF2_32_7]|nr:MAG: hypothetical protein A2104_06500 [Candidatus Melainabacteria bacterium GWF2_32_7]
MVNAIGSNPMQDFYKLKDQTDLKSQISKLITQLGSAQTPEAKARISNQIQNLSQSSGQSLSNLGVDTGSIFSPKMALMATPNNAAAPAANANAIVAPAANAAPTANANNTKETPKEGAVSKKEGEKVVDDLNTEMGIENKGGNLKEWAKAAKEKDEITVKDKNGKEKDGEKIEKGDILEVKSAKHGLVKIEAGGDGEMNGKDDKVLSVGGQAAANGAQNGLNNINQAAGANAQDPTAQKTAATPNAQAGQATPAAAPQKTDMQEGIAKFNQTGQPVWNKAECPACKGKGCKYCSDAVPPAAQGVQPAAANPAQQTPALDVANTQTKGAPQVNGMVNQAQNPQQLSETEIKNLLAAIMQLANKQQ